MTKQLRQREVSSLKYEKLGKDNDYIESIEIENP